MCTRMSLPCLDFLQMVLHEAPSPLRRGTQGFKAPGVGMQTWSAGKSGSGTRNHFPIPTSDRGAMSKAGGQRTSPQHSVFLLSPGRKQHPQGKKVNGRTRPLSEAPSLPLAQQPSFSARKALTPIKRATPAPGRSALSWAASFPCQGLKFKDKEVRE